MKLFHEAESKTIFCSAFPRKEATKQDPFPSTIWLTRERERQGRLSSCAEEAGPSTQGSKPHPCSIYTASGKMPPGSWTCPSGRLHQSGISLGKAQLLYLKSLFCQCFQSSSFSKGLTAFSYANQTKKRQLHSPKCQWGKSRLNTMVIHLFGSSEHLFWKPNIIRKLCSMHESCGREWCKDLIAHEPKTATGISVCTNAVLPNRSGHTYSLVTADVNWFQRNIFINCFIKN